MAKKSERTVPPPDYSEALAAKLCSLVATGRTVDVACALTHPGLTEDAIYLWMFRSAEFVSAWREAKRAAMFKYLEDTIVIADDDSGDTYQAVTKDGETYDAPNSAAVRRAELKIKARQWAMQNMNRDVFGETPRGGAGDGDGPTTVKIVGGLPD